MDHIPLSGQLKNHVFAFHWIFHGKLENDMIISKWGIGLIWKHSLFELPLSYGSTVKYSDGDVDNKVLELLLSEI